jgi:hypothetical protein
VALFSAKDPDGVALLTAEYNDLRTVNAERIDRQKLYREENARVRDPGTLKKAGDPSYDYGRPKSRGAAAFRHDIQLPLGKALNVKHSYRISGKLPDCIVDQRDESPQERYRSDTMEKIVWAIMHASRGNTQFSDGAWDGSEIGATCFDMYWDEQKQLPIFRACDPVGVVEVCGAADPHDFNTIYRSWDVPFNSLLAEYQGKTIDGQLDGVPVRIGDIEPSHTHAGVKMVTVAQRWDKTRTVRFVPGSNVKLLEYVHDYGFVPYVIIPNVGPARDIWGWADYEFIRAISHYISGLFSREADIIRAVANGTYIEKGTGQNAEVIKQTLSEGGVIPSKREGSLDPVQPPDVPAFEEQHSQRAMELFKMLGFAPDAAWGNGFSGSGTDRGLMLQPMVEFTAMKQMNWEAGLGRLFSMAFRMIEKKMTTASNYTGVQPSRAGAPRRFSIQLGPDLPAQKMTRQPTADTGIVGSDFDESEFVDLPRSPRELFASDYCVRFIWNNRLDPDDPAFVLSELNKFEHGAQSLETTLERLGFEAPQDEIKRIESEAERFPWLNNGMIALIRAQLSQSNQGDGGGNPGSPTADLSQGTATASGPQGAALGADGALQALGGSAIGIPSGGA